MRLSSKRAILLLIVVLLVLVAGLASLSLFGPSTPIVVSRNTTYLTAPLDPFGNVNYVEAIRRQMSEGVTPENNAAVLIWQALGPAEIPPERRGAFFSELGITPLPADGEYFAEIKDFADVKQQAIEWMLAREAVHGDGPQEGSAPDPDVNASELDHRRLMAEVDAFDRFVQRTGQTMHQPWRADAIAPLAEWLKQNKTPLELTVQATGRTKYYSPLMVDNRSGARLLTMLLPDIQNARGLARALCQRAMLHLGEGRPHEAWRDLMAVHRLARLIGRQGVLIQQLVAVAIDGLALRADAALLHEGDLSAEDLREIRQFLMTVSPPCDMQQAVGSSERLMILDVLAHATQQGLADLNADLGVSVFGRAVLAARIDWNVPLTMANVWYDKLTAAMEKATIAERQEAIAVFEKELQEMVADAKSPGRLVGALVSSRKRSELVGDVMLSLLLPAVSAAQHAEDRSLTSLRLIQVAAALAIHRSESGDYPNSLSDLSEELRGALPVDPFSEKPFHYERRGDGYVLWSVGQNLADDKASGDAFFSTVGGEPAADGTASRGNQDDIVLRMPWVEPMQSDVDSY
jgi:hypothetical protein